MVRYNKDGKAIIWFPAAHHGESKLEFSQEDFLMAGRCATGWADLRRLLVELADIRLVTELDRESKPVQAKAAAAGGGTE